MLLVKVISDFGCNHIKTIDVKQFIRKNVDNDMTTNLISPMSIRNFIFIIIFGY